MWDSNMKKNKRKKIGTYQWLEEQLEQMYKGEGQSGSYGNMSIVGGCYSQNLESGSSRLLVQHVEHHAEECKPRIC